MSNSTSSRRDVLRDAKVLHAIRRLSKDEDLLPSITAIDLALQKQPFYSDLWGTTRNIGNFAVCDRCENTDENCWDCNGTGLNPMPFSEVISGLRRES